MSFDPLPAVGSVQQLAATVSSLGPALSAAAPQGNFGAVLSQVNSEMAAVEGGGSTPTTPTSAPAAPTSGYLSTQYSPSYAARTGLPSPPSTVAGAQNPVVADAEQYLGVPYRWGGTNPATGLDCSGLVQRVYSDLGISLPRTSQEQATVGTPVASLADAQPGDLVFFEPTSSGPGHVGIYAGNGMMIDAPHTGAQVREEPVGQPVEIRRILPGSTSSDALLAAAGSSSPAMQQLGVPAALQPLFAEAGARYGVDPLLLAAVAKQESGFDPSAVSSAGAEGLMQLMPGTAAGLGVSALDPGSAIDGAAQLLSGYLNDYGGSVPLALAAYNAGPAAVSTYGGVPPYGQTQSYVSNITSMLASAQGVN